jgi:O-antigen ligase
MTRKAARAHLASSLSGTSQLAEFVLLPLLCRNASVCAAACAIILRLYLPGLTVEMGENSLVWLFAWLSFLFMLLDAVLENDWQWRSPMLTLAILAFGSVAFLSAAWASYPIQAAYQGMNWLSDISLFFVILYWTQRHDIAPYFLSVLLACFLLELAYVLYQYFIGLPATRAYAVRHSALLYQTGIGADNMPLLMEKLSLSQAFGHFTLTNSLGGYLIMYLPLLLLLVRRNWRRTVVWLWLVLLAMSSLCLLFSKSRGSMLAVAALAILWLLWRNWHSSDARWLVTCVILCAASLATVWLLCCTTWGEVLGQSSASFVMRLGYWTATWQMWQDHPWCGVGIGNFSDHYYSYRMLWIEEVNKAHNFYLQWPAETGIFGSLVLLWLAWAAWRLIVRAGKNVAYLTTPPQENSTAVGRRECTIVFPWIFLLAPCLAFFLVAASGRLVEVEPFLAWLAVRLGQPETAWQEAALFLYYLAVPVLATVWFVLFRLLCRIRLDGIMRQGLLLGLIAFLLHNAVDIDFYDSALSQTAWLFLALILVNIPITASYRPAFMYKASCLVATCAGMLWLSLSLIPQLLALAHVKQALPGLRQQIEEAGNNKERSEITRVYENYLALGCKLSPGHHEMNDALAVIVLEKARWMATQRHVTPERLAVELAQGEACLSRTILWRTHFAPAYFSRAQFHWEAAKLWQGVGERQRAEESLAKAITDIDKALAIYPAKAVLCALAGELAEMQGNRTLASQWFHKALYLNDIGTFMWVNLPTEVEEVTRHKLAAYLNKR